MRSSEIASVSFATTRLHEGYAIPEVDAFLKTVRDAIRKWESGEHGGLVAVDVVNARFTPVKFFKAYNEMQVDDFLDEVVATLAAYESGTEPDDTASEKPEPGGAIQAGPNPETGLEVQAASGPAGTADAAREPAPEPEATADAAREPETLPEATAKGESEPAPRQGPESGSSATG